MAYSQLINGIYWGYNPLILTFDPNFLVFNFIKFQTELATQSSIFTSYIGIGASCEDAPMLHTFAVFFLNKRKNGKDMYTLLGTNISLSKALLSRWFSFSRLVGILEGIYIYMHIQMTMNTTNRSQTKERNKSKPKIANWKQLKVSKRSSIGCMSSDSGVAWTCQKMGFSTLTKTNQYNNIKNTHATNSILIQDDTLWEKIVLETTRPPNMPSMSRKSHLRSTGKLMNSQYS